MVPLVAVALAAGCAEGREDPSAERLPAGRTTSAPRAAFPAPAGRSLAELRAEAPGGPRLVPVVRVLERGRTRVAFTLEDSARRHVHASAVALYTARGDGTGLRGPYAATRVPLAADPAFRSRAAQRDLEGRDAFYVAQVPFAESGAHAVTALARLDGRLVGSTRVQLRVGAQGAEGGPPGVGEQAVAVHTDTREDVRGDLVQLSTRRPPLVAMHEHDLADVLGRRPVVLLFASPRLCRVRTSGPVLDLAEQVRQRSGDDVAFIHQEIWVGNDMRLGPRPQVVAWDVTSEPWAFVMDRSGKIVARFEGAFSAAELTEAVGRAKRAPGR